MHALFNILAGQAHDCSNNRVLNRGQLWWLALQKQRAWKGQCSSKPGIEQVPYLLYCMGICCFMFCYENINNISYITIFFHCARVLSCYGMWMVDFHLWTSTFTAVTIMLLLGLFLQLESSIVVFAMTAIL